MPLCESGCGAEVKEDKRVIHGHHRRGYKHTSETLKKMSEANLGKKLSDETKRKISEARKGKKLSDETKYKMSEAMKGKNLGNQNMLGHKHTEEAKRKMSELSKNQTRRPCTIETKRKISNANIGRKLSDDARKKISGHNHYNWQGGISFEPYCHKFNNSFKESIRDKFDRKCFLCSKDENDNNGKKLSVHHVNYDKECLCADVKCEFVPLCQSCHSKTNGDRDYYEKLITEKLFAVN